MGVLVGGVQCGHIGWLGGVDRNLEAACEVGL